MAAPSSSNNNNKSSKDDAGDESSIVAVNVKEDSMAKSAADAGSVNMKKEQRQEDSNKIINVDDSAATAAIGIKKVASTPTHGGPKAGDRTTTPISNTTSKPATPTNMLNVNMSNSMMTMTPQQQRPPSRSGAASVHSTGSTSISRRGGRTRSRSPTGHHIRSNSQQVVGHNMQPSSTTSVPTEVLANPSAAAAAAAAAAKSFRNPNKAGSRSMHPQHYQQQQQQQQSYYGAAQQQGQGGGPMRGGPPGGGDPYGRQQPGGAPPQYDRYPPGHQQGGPPPPPQGGNPSSSTSSSSSQYTGPQQQQQQQQGYYDPHNGSRNPLSSSHYARGSSSSSSSSRGGPPPPGPVGPDGRHLPPHRPAHYRGGYEGGGSGSIGPDGRPLSRNNGGPGGGPPPPTATDQYGYNPYHRGSRGGPPPPGQGSSGRDPYGGGQQYPGSSSSSSSSNGRSGYGGPPPPGVGGGSGVGGVGGGIDGGEQYGRQHPQYSSRGHPPPSHHSQYPSHHSQQYGGGPPPPGVPGGHPPSHHSSSSRGRQQHHPPPGSSHPGHPSHHPSQHPSYRGGDPRDGSRGGPIPPPHYRGPHPPPSNRHGGDGGRPQSRGPPPGHPDYHRYYTQQQLYQGGLQGGPQGQQGKAGVGGVDGAGNVKATRTVIGTATPLHLPRAKDPNNKVGVGQQQSSHHPQQQQQQRPSSSTGGVPPPQQQPRLQQQQQQQHSSSVSRRGSAESVFRGRPESSSASSNNNNNDSSSSNNNDSSNSNNNSNNPKSVLDSLQTPSNSFEEKKSSSGNNNKQLLPSVAKDPSLNPKREHLSPEDPPRIRNPVSNGGELIFDPQRSPKEGISASTSALQMGPPQLTSSLDMAPSFSLFNQSFDSLGDTAQFFNVGGPLDGSMLNASQSFDVTKTGSPVNGIGGIGDRADHSSLQLTSSSGTLKLNASMSGALFGMSPTNSFGNGPTSSFSTNTPRANVAGAVTLLGGSNDRSASPSQVLDIYHSQSKGGSGGEVDIRLSASIGSPMIGTTGSYSSRPFATEVDGGPSQPSLDRGSGGGDYYNKSSRVGGSSSGGGGGGRVLGSHLSPRPSQQHYASHPSSSSHHHLHSQGVGGGYNHPASSSPHHNQYRSHRAASVPSSSRQYPLTKDGTPHFYHMLCKHKDAFKDVTFLLPELKKALLASSSPTDKVKKEQQGYKASNDTTPKRGGRQAGNRYDEPTDAESVIARRRIVSAVCAFGGTFIGSRMNNPASSPKASSSNSVVASSSTNKNSNDNKSSIFREKKTEPATVTPSSSGASSSAATAADQHHHNSATTKISREQAKYDGALPTRYYESDNRLSWEFEENPPIGSNSSKDGSGGDRKGRARSGEDGKVGESPNKKRRTGINSEYCADADSDNESKGDGDDDDDDNEDDTSSKKTKGGIDGDDGKDQDGSSPESKRAQKLRYRCKLCGQPKTNHVCPYQQSLVRSIGAMVHPAVNAFTAAEPGILATDLKEMNNLAISAAAVAAQAANAEMDNDDDLENSPMRGLPTPDRSSSRTGNNQDGRGTTTAIAADVATSVALVTPESTVRSGGGGGTTPSSIANSPVSSSNGDLTTPQRHRAGTPGDGSRSGTPANNGPASSSSGKRRKMMSNNNGASAGATGDQTDLLFVEEMELKPEQFRLVTPSKTIDSNPDAFTYPALPLPYAQRKRLSDNLFSLSKEIPQLTDECASVLREARERDLWDLAVAELMTQVVVVVHCHDNDMSFEGLRRYLLTLGFTC